MLKKNSPTMRTTASCVGALAWGLLLLLPSIVEGFASTRMPLQLRESRALSARAAPATVQIFVSAAHDDGDSAASRRARLHTRKKLENKMADPFITVCCRRSGSCVPRRWCSRVVMPAQSTWRKRYLLRLPRESQSLSHRTWFNGI
jgi:hypothetical protein